MAAAPTKTVRMGMVGIGVGGAPVAGSCGTVGAAVGDGVVVGSEGHVVGIAPSVRVTGRDFEASATSACVVDNASGAAVCEEPGLAKPRPPLSNWKVRRSLTRSILAERLYWWKERWPMKRRKRERSLSVVLAAPPERIDS